MLPLLQVLALQEYPAATMEKPARALKLCNWWPKAGPYLCALNVLAVFLCPAFPVKMLVAE